MKVILKQNVKNLGMVGSIVEVKPGYARNFLVPHRLAEIATEGAIKNWQLGAERRAKRIEAELAEARAIAEKLAGVVLPFTKTVNSDGVVFGSVNKADIFKALTALGHNIAKDSIELNMPIKALGETEVGIYLKPTVTATIKVQINPLTTVEEKIADAKPEAKAEEAAEAK
ncbi:MAG: 50S ribosomal protein L9 [Candidatus Avelusimicrobium sp.]|uniref:50S ribosomal protein L9 n=1 Tax=Candidatus Avelusimicrobium sp. TaxID=3048833 RepID=UPI003EFE1F4C